MAMRLAVFCLLLMVVSSFLKIQAPDGLVSYFTDKYSDGLVPYSIANYGDVPYGKSISGEVGLPSVLEDCIYEELPENQRSKPILLVERNDCTFTQKSINVQKEGGRLAIVMDNRDENPGNVIMVDDGRGAQVHIPTILIGLEDGQAILRFLQTSSVVLTVSFPVPVRNHSQLSVWIDITQHQNFVFLRKLKPYLGKISEHIDFSVAYPTRSCTTCDSSDCFYQGRYCRSDSQFNSIDNKGQLLIMQQLRQYFLFEQSQNKWWQYILAFDQQCDDLASVQECSDKVFKKIGVSTQKIKNKVMASFGTEDNQVLKNMAEIKKNSAIAYYPSVVVNNVIYRGNLEPFQVYELICQTLDPQPEGCSGYVVTSNSNLWQWILFIVVLSVIFGVFLIVCFRRMARRQLSQKINNQVNELVNQYITMYEHDRYSQAIEMPERKESV